MRKKDLSFISGVILAMFFIASNWSFTANHSQAATDDNKPPQSSAIKPSGVVRIGVGIGRPCDNRPICQDFRIEVAPFLVECNAPPATFTINVSAGTAPFKFSVKDPNNNSVPVQPTDSERQVTFVANIAGFYNITATDANGCDPCEKSVAFTPCVTFTQSGWGKKKPKFNGEKRVKTIRALLKQIVDRQEVPLPLTVGTPGSRSLTFPDESAAQCILDLLPASGPPASLPAGLGDVTINPNTCDTIPPRVDTLFRNDLLGNTIALALNLRIDNEIDSFRLCKNLVTKTAIPPPIPTSHNPKGFVGYWDNRVDPTDPGKNFTIPTPVLRAIAAGSPLEVQGKFTVTITGSAPANSVERLLILANLALSGQNTDGASFADVNAAIDAVNRAFDRGRFVSSCTFPQPANLEITYSPNPVPQSSFACSGTQPAWSFDITVRETAGVGITVNGFIWNFYDKDFNLINQVNSTSDDFVNFFRRCGPASRYIPPNGQACASVCVQLAGRPRGIVVIEIFGVDDNGNNTIYSSFPLTLLGS